MKGRKYTVEIINVGNELLDGRTVNTNLNWICGRLSQLGYVVVRATIVRDVVKDIVKVMKEAVRRRPRWIFVSGGLGPTHDDRTLEAVGKAFGKRLVLYKDIVKILEQKYRNLAEQGIVKDPALTNERLKMAKLPEGSRPLKNVVGTAPGVLMVKGNTMIVCLPGVPRELMNIFENELAPMLEREARGRGFTFESVTVRGVVESRLAPLLVETMKRFPSVYLKSNPKGIEDGSVVVVDFITEKRHRPELEKAIQYFQERLQNI